VFCIRKLKCAIVAIKIAIRSWRRPEVVEYDSGTRSIIWLKRINGLVRRLHRRTAEDPLFGSLSQCLREAHERYLHHSRIALKLGEDICVWDQPWTDSPIYAFTKTELRDYYAAVVSIKSRHVRPGAHEWLRVKTELTAIHIYLNIEYSPE
jgi:hypothetical protein